MSPNKIKRIAKSNAERQSKFREGARSSPSKYAALKEYWKAAQSKSRCLKAVTLTVEQKEVKKKKETERKAQYRRNKRLEAGQSGAQSPPYKCLATLNKAVVRASTGLPDSKKRKKAVVKQLAFKLRVQLSPRKPAIKRKPRLSPNAIALIKEFYLSENVSQWCPGKKDITTVKEGGISVKREIRYLQLSIPELYSEFKSSNPNLKVGLTKFRELRPAHVYLSSKIPMNMCLCKIHENAKLLLSALNKSTKKKEHVIPSYSSEFPATVVCPDATPECWYNKCEECKV